MLFNSEIRFVSNGDMPLTWDIQFLIPKNCLISKMLQLYVLHVEHFFYLETFSTAQAAFGTKGPGKTEN
jgi:hypothetical protein